jgi:hypothetical protein
MDLNIARQYNWWSDKGTFNSVTAFIHKWLPHVVLWCTVKYLNTSGEYLIATSGDYLRLWNVDSENKVEMKALLNNNKNTGSSLMIVVVI